MSVFRGSIAEYPGVVVDNFTNCERGRAFFLSHCHKDHMTGLGSPAIFNTLQRRSSSLYCSEVTCSLLLKDPSFAQLAPFLKELPMEQPVSMTLDPSPDCSALNFTVTLLPAGHCPGSAMFFFQGEKGNVLYTGDFRLTLDETKRLRPLHCDNRLLDITTLYVDTTFCHPIATKIPSRDVSRDFVVNQIDRWLSQDPGNVVHLQCGMFGYEHIFMALAKKFNTKIHIATWKINAYSELPSVVDCLTEDGSSTRIHCCNFLKGVKRRIGLPCGSFTRYGRPPRVLTVRPSTIWFLSTAKTFKEPFAFMPECNMYRVLHSMHASYSEVCDFITYLKPRRIVPCVIPVGDASLSDVNRRLKMLLPQSEVQDAKQPPELKPTTLTTTNHSNQSRKRNRETEEHCKVEDFDSDSCDSSDDTIDEFVSSEDISQSKKPRSFAKSTIDNTAMLGAKHLGLPSMLSIHCSSAIGRPNTRTAEIDELKYVSETSSERSSGNVTVGSLQQMSLELSEDLEEKTASSVANTGPGVNKQSSVEKKLIKPDNHNKNETRNSRTDLLQPSLDLSLVDGSPLQHKGQGKRESDRLIMPNERDNAQLPSDGEEWHLTFDGSSENSNNSLEDKKVIDCKETDKNTNTVDCNKEKDKQQSEGLTPKINSTMVTPPTKRHKTSKKRKKTSRERKRRSHHCKDHREHRDHNDHKDKQTDLLTPVEGDAMASVTPRKLFHEDNSDNEKESPKQRKKSRKSKAKRDKKNVKKAEVVIIDLTQEDDVIQTKAVVTGSTRTDDLIKDAQKGKSRTQGQPCPPSKYINTDHQVTRTFIMEPNIDETEADSDITFYEEGSEHHSILGSPSYLPPTPGRENVASILKRKSIAFSE